MFNNSIFGDKEEIIIPPDCNVVFVSDAFAEDYVGGAELTTKAIIDSAPDSVSIFKIHASKITQKTIESGYQKYWVFGNYTTLDPNLIPLFVRNCKYSILEFDYKFCKYRSIEKHGADTGKECDCHEDIHGKYVSAFKHGAKTVFWMSEAQLAVYTQRFPFLEDPNEGSRQIILSSVFSEHTFAKLFELKNNKSNNGKYIVLGSESWIKGKQESIQYCDDNNLEYDVIWGVDYGEFLEKLSESAGLVYMPLGGDTCPRMVLEAQLMDKEVITNENVQHMQEFPFTGGTNEDIWDYMTGRANHFWVNTIDDMDMYPRISGYTTTYNCISQEYPFIQSICSMLPFCEEVVVMDGGSDDGTWEKLEELSNENEKIKIYKHEVDWSAKRSAIQDGAQKARARSKCTQKYCWQMDVDEIVHEKDYASILKIATQFPAFVDLIALPVVEYWGSAEKVRLDVTPWKWRISRNKPFITHGVPQQLRKTDEDGLIYAEKGTDGCDYIDARTGNPIQHASFYSPEIHEARVAAMNAGIEINTGNMQPEHNAALANYNKIFNNVISNVPSVWHYSWYNIERKIKTYKNFWQRHWESLYNEKTEDSAENNMFFDKPWADVTDKEIKELAKRLEKEMGGWIFHTKVDFSTPTPHLTINFNEPEIMHGKNISSNLQLQS